MNARDLIEKATAAGITLIQEPDGRLTAEGPAPAISALWPEIRQHKADVLALLPANDAPDVVGLVAVGGLLPVNPSIQHADGPSPLASLYRTWFHCTDEERVYLVLNPGQVQEVLVSGAVSQDVALSSVLVAIKVGNAAGLLTIPQDRWDGLEALRIMHGDSPTPAVQEVNNV